MFRFEALGIYTKGQGFRLCNRFINALLAPPPPPPIPWGRRKPWHWRDALQARRSGDAARPRAGGSCLRPTVPQSLCISEWARARGWCVGCVKTKSGRGFTFASLPFVRRSFSGCALSALGRLCHDESGADRSHQSGLNRRRARGRCARCTLLRAESASQSRACWATLRPSRPGESPHKRLLLRSSWCFSEKKATRQGELFPPSPDHR